MRIATKILIAFFFLLPFNLKNLISICQASTTTTTLPATTTTTTLPTPLANWHDFGWSTSFLADNNYGVGDGNNITTWTDGQGNYDLGTDINKPVYDADGCPNGTPSVDFSTNQYMYNAATRCADGNNRCTVVIIGRWSGMIGGYGLVFAGYGDDVRTEINIKDSKWLYSAGGTLTTDPDTIVDTNFHAIMWDLNGFTNSDCTGVDTPADCCTGSGTGTCNSDGNTPWTVDTDSENSDAGPNAPTGGITIGASRLRNGGFADFDYCAIGLYEGDATADGQWPNLQQYACETWGVELGKPCVFPQTSITDPSDGAYLNAAANPYTITGTASDDIGVTQVEVLITPGGSWTTKGVIDTGGATPWSTWEYSWTLPDDGDYTIQSRATDTNSQTGTSGVITVHVDTTPGPSVFSTDPTNGATDVTLDSNVTITWDENVDCGTVNTTNITSDSPGWALSSCSESQAVFTTSGQALLMTYNVSVTTAVTDVGGNPIGAENNFSYTTAEAAIPLANWHDFGFVNSYLADDNKNYGDGYDISTWEDGQSTNKHLTAGANAPNYNVDGCPNAQPSVVFNTDEYVYNTTASCADGNNRCTVIVIGRWTQPPGNADLVFAGNGTDYRTEMTITNGKWMLSAGASNWTDVTNTVDTNFHAIMWDLNGFTNSDCTSVDTPADCCTGSGTGTCNSDGNTPWTVDTTLQTPAVSPGPNAPIGGYNIAANRYGNGGFADFEYCAIGLYEGDATADGQWPNLQQYACNKWGLELGKPCVFP